MIETVDSLLNLLTLIGTITSIFLLLVFLIYFFSTDVPAFVLKLVTIIKSNIVIFTLIVSIIATLGSLFYSEVRGYVPCVLCWYQRILMYPQALVLWLALVIRDKSITQYTLFLSVLGIPIALYHYLHQLGVAKYAVCSTVGYSVSCAENFGMDYGFITIPFMAFTAFTLIALLNLFYIVKK